MNKDVYAECLVKRKIPVSAYLAEILISLVCLLSVLFAMVNPFGILVLMAAGTGAYFIFRNAKVEYEYLYVVGQLSVDKILGQSKRKTVWECSMEDVVLIAPASHGQIKQYETNDRKTLDFTSGMNRSETYAVISQKGGDKVKVLFEPNDKILYCLKQAASRKVIQP